MGTTAIKALPARLAFGRPATITEESFQMTQGRRAKREWLGMFNNSRVLENDGDTFLVHATAFAASGFARLGGFEVWLVTGETDLWVVNTSRVGVRIV